MTNSYFYLQDAESVGPFTIKALKAQNISKETKIWCSGMKDWIPAGEVEEVKHIFEQEANYNDFSELPPPPPSEKDNRNQSERNYIPNNYPPKTYLLESIIVTIFCCFPFGLIGIIHAIKVENSFYAGNYNEAIYASKNAGKWTKIGFIIGILTYILLIIFPILAMMGLISMTFTEAFF